MYYLRKIDTCYREHQGMNMISRYCETTETVTIAFKMVKRIADYQPWAKFTQDT